MSQALAPADRADMGADWGADRGADRGADKAGRKQLGRGLSALIGDVPAAGTGTADRTVPIEAIRPGRYQPRRSFDAEALDQLAESIRANGIIQPLLVRPAADGGFELIAGERRWRAAQRARLHDVPVVVRDMADAQALEIALVENLQRSDLSPLEEAEGYRRLIDEFGHTQDVLARQIGKSRPHIANMLRLLGLSEPIRDMVDGGRLSAGHARALLGAEDAEGLARRVADQGLSVRQTEALARERKPAAAPRAAPRAAAAAAGDAAKDADTTALERDLSNRLGLRVSITTRGDGGLIAFEYKSLEQLDGLLERLD